jgi:hypothetical protein
MGFPMNHVAPIPEPHRVGPVEPDLLASAIFLFAEYLARIEAETPDAPDDDDPDDDRDGDAEAVLARQIDTKAVLDLFAEELATDVKTTLNLYMRVTAVYRLLATSPSLASMALDADEPGGALRDDALIAAAKLDLYVRRSGDEGSADFDPREFRQALDDAD